MPQTLVPLSDRIERAALQFVLGVLVVTAWGVSEAAAPAPTVPQCGPYAVVGPTVIAFFGYAVTASDPNADEALADFQFYLGPIRKRYEGSRISIAECYRNEFVVSVGGKPKRFESGKQHVGYYLVRPGAEPLVVYGVNTDDDLLAVMKGYFGEAAVASADRGAR